MIDQHLAHDARHDSQKVRPVGELRFVVVEQLHPRLVDQCSGLERMSGLVPHEAPRDAPQFIINQRRQALEGRVAPLSPALEQTRNFTRHAR